MNFKLSAPLINLNAKTKYIEDIAFFVNMILSYSIAYIIALLS